jgi:hypothetical protein
MLKAFDKVPKNFARFVKWYFNIIIPRKKERI